MLANEDCIVAFNANNYVDEHVGSLIQWCKLS